jgi:hypothetical protein
MHDRGVVFLESGHKELVELIGGDIFRVPVSGGYLVAAQLNDT